MSNLQYTKDHEWIKLEGDVATIGITEYAQEALGDLVFIELPKAGTKINKGQHFSVIESVKIASEIYTPVSGEIIAVNDNLANNVDLVKSQIETGWIVKIKLDNPADAQGLMSKDQYSQYLKEVAH